MSQIHSSSNKVFVKFSLHVLYFFLGASGDFFYIIRSGEVDITKNNTNGEEESIVVLTAGKFFGEKALLKVQF